MKSRCRQRPLAAFSLSRFSAFLLISCGCLPQSSGGRIDLWAVGPSERVERSDLPRIETAFYSQAANQIEVAGAVNEVVAFQLVLRSPRFRSDLRLAFESATGAGGTLPAAAFRAFLVRPVTVTPLPGWYLRRFGPASELEVPDILIPLDSPQLSGRIPITTDRPAVVWIELAVPRDAKPGEYHGALTLRDDRSEAARIGLVVKVWNFALSDERNLTILAGVDAARVVALHAPQVGDPAAALAGLSGEFHKLSAVAAVTDACRLLHDHRLNPYVTGVFPAMRFANDGSVELNWEQYDGLTASLIDGSAYADREPAADWPVPVDRSHPAPDAMGGAETPEYARVLREYLSACGRHFAERGWSAAAFVDLTAPIPISPRERDYQMAARLGRIADLAEPRLPFVVSLFPVSMRPYGWFDHVFEDLSDVTDIWAPPARFFDVPRLTQARQLGARVWIAPDMPAFAGSTAVEGAAADARAIAWHAFQRGADVWLPQTTDWPAAMTLSPVTAPHESRGWLIYPGSLGGMQQPLPSMRLKQLRRGAQDFEYLTLLARNDRAATAELIADSLIFGTGSANYLDHYQDPVTYATPLDPNTWELARRLAAEELQAAISGAAAPDSRGIDERLEWGRLFTETRRVQLSIEGVRATTSGGGGAPGEVTFEFHVAIANRRRTPLGGRLSFAALPSGWRAGSDSTPVGPIPEDGRGRYRLVAHAPSYPLALNGRIDATIRLEGEGLDPIESSAAASAILAPRQSRPLVVDGRLDDWDPARGNAAADFVEIGPEPHFTRPGQFPAHTGERTVIYAAHDDEFLYFGLQCRTDRSATGPIRRDNQVTYDGLIPQGDDLVEILIDPTNAGIDASDLFHLVLKDTGALWTERGIGADRPIAPVAPWGANIRYVTVADADGWTAEVRIPLESFDIPNAAQGGRRRRSAIWGLNVTRRLGRLGSYSNWAAATRHCYHPRSLGNMAWVD